MIESSFFLGPHLWHTSPSLRQHLLYSAHSPSWEVGWGWSLWEILKQKSWQESKFTYHFKGMSFHSPWMSFFCHLKFNIRSTDGPFGKVLRLKLHLHPPTHQKKRYKNTPRKIVVLASLQPSPPSQKNVKKTDAFLPPSSKQSLGIRMIRDPVFRGGFFAVGKLNFCLPTSLGGQGNQRNWILSRINAHIAMLGMQHMGPK